MKDQYSKKIYSQMCSAKIEKCQVRFI